MRERARSARLAQPATLELVPEEPRRTSGGPSNSDSFNSFGALHAPSPAPHRLRRFGADHRLDRPRGPATEEHRALHRRRCRCELLDCRANSGRPTRGRRIQDPGAGRHAGVGLRRHRQRRGRDGVRFGSPDLQRGDRRRAGLRACAVRARGGPRSGDGHGVGRDFERDPCDARLFRSASASP